MPGWEYEYSLTKIEDEPACVVFQSQDYIYMGGARTYTPDPAAGPGRWGRILILRRRRRGCGQSGCRPIC